MPERLHDISVIMPTRGLAQRAGLLRRALHSVLTQHGVRVTPIVVVNGPDHDPALVREIRGDPRVRVAVLETANLPAALRAGREMVDTPWFAELDDDDILLADALATRVQALCDRPDVDAAISNGLRRSAAGDVLSIRDVQNVDADPLRALVFGRSYWLLPGSWLCRTDTVGAEFFHHMPPFRECTYLAIRLASTRRLTFLQRPSVVWHADTPESESKSHPYAIAGAPAMRRILELDLPSDVRAALRNMFSRECHANAELYLRQGRLKNAWRWHLRSLRQPGGWRRLPYTRHLVSALLRS